MTRPLIKVCGMTREADALLCAELGADLLGFIFHPGSPRNTTPEFPARLRLPGVRKVGLFVGQNPMEAMSIMAEGRLDLAQLHGAQTESFCQALASRMGPQRIIKVVWPEKAASLEDFQAEIDRYAPYCALFLADAGKGGGGHGRAIGSGGEAGSAPNNATGILARARFPRPWLLAGGLAPANLDPLFSRFRPDGLDINSGVESAPGIKDETLLRAAFTAIDALGAAQNCEVTP